MGMFGIFLFLTYYLQLTLALLAGRDRPGLPADDRGDHGRRPRRPAGVLMPRLGPRPLIPAGLLAAAGGLVLLASQLGLHTSYLG